MRLFQLLLGEQGSKVYVMKHLYVVLLWSDSRTSIVHGCEAPPR